MRAALFALTTVSFFFFAGCGVKGPPLPPENSPASEEAVSKADVKDSRKNTPRKAATKATK